MGLLSFINPEDEGQRQRNIAFFQQLAQAGAPSATQNSWALGLANGFGEGNKAQLAHQRYAGTQDLQKQEIDMNKLRLDAYKQEQERIDLRTAAIARFKASGLSDDDLKLIQGAP